ncbi:MAG: hypothetical protein ACI81R_000644 [Bradymonadia bacterium]|jgi:hypothetical protein
MRASQRKTIVARAERGSALIITMLVILAVTGLGAVAFTSAIRAASQARNFEAQKQATFVAEVALGTSVEFLECNLRFLQNLERYPYPLESGDPVGCDFTEGSVFGATPFGRNSRLTPFYRVSFAQPVPARRAPEYDESYCYVRVDMQGSAGLTDEEREGVNVATTNNRASGSEIRREFVGFFYAGPVQCPSAAN